MPEKTDSSVRGSGGVGVFAFGPMRVHNDHLLEGKRTARRCGVCETGLGSLMATPEAKRPEVAVVESDGGDGGGDTAPPPDSWTDQSGG